MYQSGRLLKAVRCAAVIAVGAAALGVGTASATPVTSWDFTSSAQFNTDAGAAQFTPGTAPTDVQDHKISWGDPVGSSPSSLVIDPTGSSDSVTTFVGGGSVPSSFTADAGFTLTHNNFPLYKKPGHWLTNAEINVSVNLTNPNYGTVDLNMPITFTETVNTLGNPGDCAVSPETGFGACPDIFVIDSSSFNQEFTFDDPDGEMDGRSYFLSLFPVMDGGVGFLSDAACAEAGAANGCLGFVTQEESSNDMTFGLVISTDPLQFSNVPGPGAFGLLGLGLIGIAAFAERRRRKLPLAV